MISGFSILQASPRRAQRDTSVAKSNFARHSLSTSHATSLSDAPRDSSQIYTGAFVSG